MTATEQQYLRDRIEAVFRAWECARHGGSWEAVWASPHHRATPEHRRFYLESLAKECEVLS